MQAGVEVTGAPAPETPRSGVEAATGQVEETALGVATGPAAGATPLEATTGAVAGAIITPEPGGAVTEAEAAEAAVAVDDPGTGPAAIRDVDRETGPAPGETGAVLLLRLLTVQQTPLMQMVLQMVLQVVQMVQQTQRLQPHLLLPTARPLQPHLLPTA